MAQILVVAGGIYCLGLVIFHVTFWHLFRWPSSLRASGSVNCRVTQIMNINLILLFLIFAVICLFHSVEMVSTALGQWLLAMIACLFFLRGGQQIYFFGIDKPLSNLLLAIFFAGGSIFALAFAQV